MIFKTIQEIFTINYVIYNTFYTSCLILFSIACLYIKIIIIMST